MTTPAPAPAAGPAPVPSPDQLIACTPKDPNRRRHHTDPLNGEATHHFAPYPNRVDLFHQNIWQNPPFLSGRYHYADDGVQPHTDYLDDPKDFARMLRCDRTRMTLNLCNQFHQLTAQQLCCWLGLTPMHTTRYFKPAYDQGLLERGRFVVRRHGRLPYIYALNDDKPLRRYLRRHDNPAAVLGTPKPLFSARHIRHNLLVAETTLRTMEVNTSIAAVTGTPHARATQLIDGLPTEPRYTQLAGDAVWWRNDGLRIVIELVASDNQQHIASKMARWATVLAASPPDADIVVVWLNTITDQERGANLLRRLFEQLVELGTTTLPNGIVASPSDIARVRARMTLAAWTDWYPDLRDIATAGRHISVAVNPNGRAWVPVNLTDLIDGYPGPDQPNHTPPEHHPTPDWAPYHHI